MRRTCVLSALFFALLSAQGQVGLYGGFSGASTNVPNEPWLYGTTFGGYYNALKLPLINLGVNGQAAILNGSGSLDQQKIINGLVGPRVEFHLPLVPLKPYVEGHLGASSIAVGQGFARIDKTVFSYGFAGGGDLTILPRLDWRVAEYSYTRSSVYGGINQSTLTTGLVLRLPVP